MIALGTAKIAVEKFNIEPGIGTVIAGIATVALSSLLRASLPKFAEGTMTTGPMVGLLGDNKSGREYVTPSESISRLAAEINSYSGGRNLNIEVTGKMSGDDILFVTKRAEAKQGRSY